LGFYFGLFDNFELSKALGLGYETTDLDKTKQYRVEIKLPDANPARYVPGRSVVIYQDPIIRPKPAAPSVECNNNLITLSALLAQSAPSYSSFKIERATSFQDSFVAINERPLIVNYAYADPLISFKDSIGTLSPMQYRLVGKDFWGDFGPASDVVTIDPCHIIFPPPYPVLTEETEDRGAIQINWMIPDTLQGFLQGFNLFRAKSKFSAYEKLNSQLLPSNQFEYVDYSPFSVAYYQVEARYSSGVIRKSLTVHAALLDTKPPAAPTNLEVQLDTATMIVTLQWDAVSADDLKGYRVSFAHGPGAPKFLLNNIETTRRSICDTLDLGQLHQQVYYWVTSRDFSQNESFYSDSVVVIIPNRIPPVAPRITHIISDENYLDIYYDRSASQDHIEHILQKKNRSGRNWSSAYILPHDWNNRYRDTLITSRDTFEYRILAVDQGGLESTSNVMSASLLEPLMLLPFEYVKAERKDNVITIYFDYRDDMLPGQFRLLAGKDQDQMQTLGLLNAQEIILQTGIKKEEEASTYTLYRYQIGNSDTAPKYFKVRAISSSGKVSPYSRIFNYQ
jgi:hypothetical protein